VAPSVKKKNDLRRVLSTDSQVISNHILPLLSNIYAHRYLPTIVIVVAQAAQDHLYFEDLLQRNPDGELCKPKEEARWTVKEELRHRFLQPVGHWEFPAREFLRRQNASRSASSVKGASRNGKIAETISQLVADLSSGMRLLGAHSP
jgi:hypothetical protein